MARDRSLDIAVTGMAVRFPACNDLHDWWTALRAGRVLTKRYERQELLDSGVPPQLVDDPEYVPVRGHLDGALRFDNSFFGISGRDAALMDPQHRLMLELAWNALENAGYNQPSVPERTGVYASSSAGGYLRSMLTGAELDPPTLDQVIHGTEPDFIASRIAYKLGLTGPAMGVQTACSSSLVGVHLAVQALLADDCDAALVVGAGIGFPQAGYLHLPGGVLSASGRCRPFDDEADGVVPGSGAACVVLRRLEDALQHGPDPHGVILGTAINNDGARKAGYFAPSKEGQEAVLRAAMHAADLDAGSLGYLETHGTGTRVGDPIEWAAASSILDRMGAATGQVAVGALKANMGHTDAASGLAALIKALLVVREGTIPPVAGLTRLNSLLEPDGSPLHVPLESERWSGPEPRRAGISAFGIGGTNAHVIVEAPPSAPRRDSGTGEEIIVLSANDSDALERARTRLGGHLAAHDTDLADLSFTLAAHRKHFGERLAVTGRSAAEVARRLTSGEVVRGSASAAPAAAIFSFPGQGAHHPGMAAPFAEAMPGFTEALAECLSAFPVEQATRIRTALLDRDFPAAELARTELAQPALFVLEHSAATALIGLGVVPTALVGHSLGEVTAACLAGVLDIADAARFVTARGHAMQACEPGRMVAIGCDEDSALALVAETGLPLELAVSNGPDNTVLAGPPEAVEKFAVWLGDGVFAQLLPSTRAFHSSLVASAVPTLDRVLDTVRLRRPGIALATNLTGEIIQIDQEVPGHVLVEQVRRPVRFAENLAELARRCPGLLVEIGPGHTLSHLAEASGLPAVPLSPARTANPSGELRAALATLWTRGHPIDPRSLAGDGQHVHVPGYSFHGPEWIAPEAARPATGASEPAAEFDADAESATGQDAGTAVPAIVRRLWMDLLGCPDVDDDSDFFQLGGDSLLVTHLARELAKELAIKVPLRSLLLARDLGAQTALVAELLDQPGAQR